MSYSQDTTDQVDLSIKKEVRLHPDVHLKYANTSFSIDRYVIQDPYILVYSNTTGSFYLINQKNQLIVDQFNISKEYPKLKTSNVSFYDQSGARVKLRSPFYNNGITMGNANIESYSKNQYFTGLIKLGNKYYILLVDILNDKINTTLKEYNIKDYFKKPAKPKLAFHDYTLYMDLLRTSKWNNQELFIYYLDPYVEKLPKDSTRSYSFLFKNSIYAINNNELTSVFKEENNNPTYSHSSYITSNENLLILNNEKDSIYLYSNEPKFLKSKKIPRANYDSISYQNKRFVLKNGQIIQDGFNEMPYIIIPNYSTKTYSVYSTDNKINQFTLIKTFVSDLSLRKIKIYKGNIYFLASSNASEPAKLFYYKLYNNKNLGDTIKLTSNTQQAFSLFTGELNRVLWFKQMYGMENIKGDVYFLPKNHVKNKIKNAVLSKEDIKNQKSIEGLIKLLSESYKQRETNKILAHLTCFDKFDIEILEEEIKSSSFNNRIDSLFYDSPLRNLFQTLSSADFNYEGEMKTYHYEIKTENGWHIFLCKIEELWYLSSVVYKEE